MIGTFVRSRGSAFVLRIIVQFIVVGIFGLTVTTTELTMNRLLPSPLFDILDDLSIDLKVISTPPLFGFFSHARSSALPPARPFARALICLFVRPNPVIPYPSRSLPTYSLSSLAPSSSPRSHPRRPSASASPPPPPRPRRSPAPAPPYPPPASLSPPRRAPPSPPPPSPAAL